jgi:glycosyltransferase involved in cell wall biosynthesis
MKRIMTIPDILKYPPSNPYQGLFYKAMTAHGFELVKSFDLDFGSILKNRHRVDAIHIHWLPASEDHHFRGYYRSLRLFLQFFFCRCLGIKIFWTAHNLFPHDTKYYWLQYFQRFWLVRVCHFILVHFEGAKVMISRKFLVSPNKMITVHHGLYDEYYANTLSQEEAREFLKIDRDKKVFLYFGQIRPYKNVEAIIKAFKKLNAPNAVLYLVGSSDDEEYKKTISELIDDSRIRCELRFVNDAEIQYFFNCADCVILPYKNIFTSGAALLALTFKKSIIMKECDFSIEYLSENQAHILLDECTEISILEGMEAFLRNKEQRVITNENIERFKWSYIAEKLVNDHRFKICFKMA